MDSTIPRCLLLFGMILLAGFFAGSETAFSYCNRIRMKTLAEEEGNKRAARVVAITDNFDKALVTLLICINVIYVSSSTLATVFAMDLFAKYPSVSPYASVISTVGMTVAVFVFSETIPKNIARANSDKLAMLFSFPIWGLMKVLTPVSAVFSAVGNALKKRLNRGKEEPTVTEDEFSDIVEDVEESGTIEPEEGEIIRSAIEFGDMKASDVMTPIESTTMVPQTITPDDLKQILLDCNYSRIPVYKGDKDRIVGILSSKDCLWRFMNGIPVTILAMMKRPYFIMPDMHLNTLFEQMEKKRTHIAIVAENGVNLGIVTMENILEEIVGDIYDEDEVPPGQKKQKEGTDQ